MASSKSNSKNNHPLAVVGARPKGSATRTVKPRAKRKPIKKKTNHNYFGKLKWVVMITVLLGAGIWFGITFKDGITYFFSTERGTANEKTIFDVRTIEVLKRHENSMVGFDISQYQGVIDWTVIDSVGSKAPLEFVFIRATMGVDAKDRAFDLNWKGARASHFIRGAYHYYRPNENSVEQAKNFIAAVKLSEGDFPPVLDIEELPKAQSMDSLVMGLKRWMTEVENHYGVRPILYSGEHYYTKHLKKWFPDHVLWIANYNFFVEEIKPEWHFWQFTEKGIVEGIDGKVDLNIYNGTKTDIRKLLIR